MVLRMLSGEIGSAATPSKKESRAMRCSPEPIGRLAARVFGSGIAGFHPACAWV